MGHRRVGSMFSLNRVGNRRKLTHSFSQKEIMEMQCDLPVSKFKDPKTIALVKENIRQTSDGSSSHRASALELGFEKAFELKRQKKKPPGTKLRCSSIICPLYDDHISYSSIKREPITVKGASIGIAALVISNVLVVDAAGQETMRHAKTVRRGSYRLTGRYILPGRSRQRL